MSELPVDFQSGRRCFALSTCLAISLLLSSLVERAQAQASGRGTEGPAESAGASNGIGPESPLVLLMAPAVQKELKLTEDQKRKVYNLIRDAGQNSRTLMQQAMIRGVGDPRLLMEAGQRHRKENDTAIGNLLEKKQNARFEQIVLQSEGPLALGRKEIATKLRLNENQTQQIQNVMGRFQQARFQLVMGVQRAAMTGGDGGNLDQSTKQPRQEAVQEIGKIVTKAQKAAFNEMLGEAFDINKIAADPTSVVGDETKATPTDADSKDPAPKDEPEAKPKTTKKGAKVKGKKSS